MTRALAVLLACAACAHGPPRATAPVRTLSDDARAALKSAPAEYGLGASQPQELGQRFSLGLQLPCTHDERLDALASLIAETLASTTQLPARSLTQWLMWREGVPGQLHAMQAWSATGDAEPLLDQGLVDYAKTVQPDSRGAPLRYGLARVLHPFGSEWAQILVITAVPLELDALPKAVKSGTKLELKGRMRVKAFHPTLFIDDSDTAVREVQLKTDADGRFTLSFEAPRAKGRRFIEVTAFEAEETPEHPQWMRSLLMVPLYVDALEATEPDDVIRAPAPNPPTLAAWPGRALQLYNQRRAAAGLKLLQLEPAATAIAAGAAKALAQYEDAPPDPHLLPRLAQAGLPTRNAQQHGGRIEYLDESTALSLYSPSLRLTLMSPSVTAVGLAYEQVPQDARAPGKESTVGQVAGSAVFVAPVGVLDPGAEAAALTAGLNQLRKAAGKSELQLDPGFSAMAMEHAKAACDGKALPADAISAQASMLGYSGGMVMTYTVTHLLSSDLGREDGLINAAGTHVAVGVCQGTLEGQPRAERVVFLVSSKSGAPARRR